MGKTDTCYGIIPYCRKENKIYYLILQHRSGKHWAFPKGHPEPQDADNVASATREFEEETGLPATQLLVHKDQRFSETYAIHDVQKTVYYYPGELDNTIPLVNYQKIEIQAWKWLNYTDALKTITHQESCLLLTEAHHFIQNFK